jgi:hypothetical protein
MSLYGDPAPFDRIASPAILLESAPWRDEAGRWLEGYARSDHPSTNGFALTGTNPSMRRKHAVTTGGLISRNQEIGSRPGSSLWLLAPLLDTDPAIDPQLPVESSPMTKGATCNRGRVDGDVEFKRRVVAPVHGQFASRPQQRFEDPVIN